jgi:hypothetical protein
MISTDKVASKPGTMTPRPNLALDDLSAAANFLVLPFHSGLAHPWFLPAGVAVTRTRLISSCEQHGYRQLANWPYVSL